MNKIDLKQEKDSTEEKQGRERQEERTIKKGLREVQCLCPHTHRKTL